ncbi:maleylpyruvate isomerase [Lentzea pudingi]|uniref:Maleylpyruvate isomerase n=1 Tax=Lentzea pudingi TaxID=1789439 RepID=A0ABQ2INP5_9PSEU|nr:maleylpyruvate isomerase family mycothiol-dependent enzyme [Lentzea pudingi]GGN23488.1 maleylpyruvate isomerase [Lentzea pudingi]
MAEGHELFMSRLWSIDDEQLARPSGLPGWSGRHLLSHIGHNARALGRLAHWAATGDPTPMYPSSSARAEEIDTGADWPLPRLREFVAEEQERLAAAFDLITGERWEAEVITAQGRIVPASIIPWLRARELWIHAYDLQLGGDFAFMPEDFLGALVEDVLTHRRTRQTIEVEVSGPPADLARWLTGRGASPRLHLAAGFELPKLPPWL